MKSTKISRRDYNLAKKWAGQKGYLLQYDRMEIEDQLEKYIEFESDLLVSNEERQKAVIKKQEAELNEIENIRISNQLKDKELKANGKRIEDLEKIMVNIKEHLEHQEELKIEK